MKQGDNKGLEKHKRLLNSRQYQRVLRRGRSYRNTLFIVAVLPNTVNLGRLGMTVSKKVSRRAVDRNRIKRLIRESFRVRHRRLPANDFVVIARQTVVKLDNQTLLAALAAMWEKHKQDKISCN